MVPSCCILRGLEARFDRRIEVIAVISQDGSTNAPVGIRDASYLGHRAPPPLSSSPWTAKPASRPEAAVAFLATVQDPGCFQVESARKTDAHDEEKELSMRGERRV
jgi:hypothetical protein